MSAAPSAAPVPFVVEEQVGDFKVRFEAPSADAVLHLYGEYTKAKKATQP